jgi:hypothetical protein
MGHSDSGSAAVDCLSAVSPAAVAAAAAAAAAAPQANVGAPADVVRSRIQICFLDWSDTVQAQNLVADKLKKQGLTAAGEIWNIAGVTAPASNAKAKWTAFV